MPPPQLVGLVVIDIAIQNQKAEEEGNEEIINQQANYELILKRIEGETEA